MPKVTYKTTEVVWLEIVGEQDKRPAKLPRIRQDGGLIPDLLGWMCQNGIWFAVSGWSTGGGAMRGGFCPHDAEQIVRWLRRRGVVPNFS